MDKTRVQEIIGYFEQCLKEDGINPSKVILFGSQRSGEATAESDIDLAIISEVFRDKDIFERAKLSSKAEIKTIKKYVVPLDIIDLTPEEYEKETSLIAQIVKNIDSN
jgi:uncharacterized protein